MGYLISQRASEFFIGSKLRAEALAALHRLAYDPAFRDWYDAEEVQRQTTFEDAMRCCAWELDNDEAGNVVGITFIGEKSWREDLIFVAIAPLVRSGSYIEMQGEDDAHWRWRFIEGTAKEIYPTVTWNA